MADEQILGGYRLRTLMSTGQTSQVWEVVEVTSHRHFAMKLLLPEYMDNPSHQRFLINEATIGKKLAHPNIIKIFAFNKGPKNPYYVMEFFPAGSLKLRIMRKETDFIQERAAGIFQKAATAFAYMNASGYVHRDIKPDNILVNAAGEVRIIDFALAKKIAKPSFFSKFFPKKGLTQGTRSYMAPEQIRAEALDGRADIYSFGATMYEVVTGRPPFVGKSNHDLLLKHLSEKPVSPVTHNKEVTDAFAALVLKMLEKKKEDRPKDFHQILMELRKIPVFKGQAATNTDEAM